MINHTRLLTYHVKRVLCWDMAVLRLSCLTEFWEVISVEFGADISVSIVTMLRAGRSRFDFLQGRFFSSHTTRPDRLWGPPSLRSSGYRGQSGRDVKVTTHICLESILGIRAAIPPLPHTSSWRGAFQVQYKLHLLLTLPVKLHKWSSWRDTISTVNFLDINFLNFNFSINYTQLFIITY
jgi:hypothetical protein